MLTELRQLEWEWENEFKDHVWHNLLCSTMAEALQSEPPVVNSWLRLHKVNHLWSIHGVLFNFFSTITSICMIMYISMPGVWMVT